MSKDLGKIEIREAIIDEIRGIQSVARKTWDHTYRETIPEGVRREFVSQAYSADSLARRIGSNVFLVAASDERVLGFADFRRHSETAVELAAIYVLPAMQGRGIGARLLEAGIVRLAPDTKVVLRVEQDNVQAQLFYEAHGFSRVAEHTEELYGQVVREVEMVLYPRTLPSRTVPNGAQSQRK